MRVFQGYFNIDSKSLSIRADHSKLAYATVSLAVPIINKHNSTTNHHMSPLREVMHPMRTSFMSEARASVGYFILLYTVFLKIA